jgi:hypothetical protein
LFIFSIFGKLGDSSARGAGQERKIMNSSKFRAGTTALGIATLTGLLATMLFAAPANAATLEPRSTPPTPAISESEWATLDSSIDVRSHVFDGASAARNGVDAAIVNDFATGWVAAGNTAIHATVDQSKVESFGLTTLNVQGCAGKNRVDYTGLQLNMYLNSCNSSKIVGMVTAGAGVASIAAVITSWTGAGGAIAGVLAGVVAISAGVLTTCSAKGRGIAGHMIPPTSIMWCNNQ